MSLSQQILNSMQASSGIRKMFEEGARRTKEFGADQVFDFSLGNPIFEPPAEVVKALQQLAQDPTSGTHRYMPNAGLPEVRGYLAERLKEESKLDFQTSDLIMTVGAGGGLNVILKTLLNRDEEVICFAPYFVEYDAYIQNHGGKPVVVQTGEDFHLDLDALAKAIGKKTKALIINSPNNPTGVVYCQEELAALGELLRAKNRELGITLHLISDDPYRRISYIDEMPNIFAAYQNSLMVTSYSKDLALPGERIGYLAISPEHQDRELLSQAAVLSLRILGFVNAPAIWQRLIPLVGDALVDLTPYKTNRDTLVQGLRGMGYELVEPQGAFYLFPKSPIPDDRAFVKMAQELNLLLVPGSDFGRAGHFRISYCFAPEKIKGSLPLFERLIQAAKP